MAVLGAHDAPLASTRSFGLSVVVNRVVCAPAIVRVGVAEQGPAASPVAGATATSAPATTSDATPTCAKRLPTMPPDPRAPASRATPVAPEHRCPISGVLPWMGRYYRFWGDDAASPAAGRIMRRTWPRP